MKFE
jgi:hypothetical protein